MNFEDEYLEIIPENETLLKGMKFIKVIEIFNDMYNWFLYVKYISCKCKCSYDAV